MTGPCERPECGGTTHTDGWGQLIRCPHACPLTGAGASHDAHDGCPGWGPDDGTHPEAPPQATLLEEAQATIEGLQYQIRRAREALGTDEPVDRCPSCDHKREFHDVDGRCWFTVDHGVPDTNLVCPCQVQRTETP